MQNPLLFSTDVCKAVAGIISKLRQGEDERKAGKLIEAHNLWLEGDLLDKTLKLKSCHNHLSILWKQLDEANWKLEESEKSLKPTADALEVANKSRTIITKEWDNTPTSQAKAEEKVESGATKVDEVKDKVKDLEEEVFGSKKDVETLDEEEKADD